MHNIIVGIDETSDIRELLESGLRQFYFGFITQKYLQKFSTQSSLNRRYRASEQFSSLEKALEVIELLHANGASVYLALNAFSTNDTMLEYAHEQYELFANKVDGIIVATFTLALFLKKQNYKKIVTSNLFGVYSVEAVKFLKKQFDPYKIILPRDITLEDIARIAEHFSEQKFECFLYGDNCRYSESFCFVEHGYDSVGFGSLCTYAMKEKKLIKKANSAYKQVVKNSSLSISEKKELLAVQKIDILSLLDIIELNLYNFNSKNIAHNLEILFRYDIEHFTSKPLLMARTQNLLKTLEGFDKAEQLLKRLKNSSPNPSTNYQWFHKLNASAIEQTLEFFAKHDNIVSYKIPSRGRNLHTFIQNLDPKQGYNYKQSQYKL